MSKTQKIITVCSLYFAALVFGFGHHLAQDAAALDLTATKSSVLLGDEEGKCGEGKCGEETKCGDKEGGEEGKCGEKTDGEEKCGDSHGGEEAEGKCGH
ncbi:MAG: hypothetical protein KDD69_19545 [Bdellovibrionales bacterium]|nr:hypothetical protein [Bdellovibrionales bacterium]